MFLLGWIIGVITGLLEKVNRKNKGEWKIKKITCGNCDNSKLVPYNPDEDVCENCGKVHEKLSDYRVTEIEEN